MRKNQIFGKYIPDCQYHLIRVHDYTTQELVDKGDELLLVMLINRLASTEDFKELGEIDMLFDSFKGYDIQKVRKESREAGKKEGKEEGKQEGKKQGKEAMLMLISAIIADGRTEEIAKLQSDPIFLEEMEKKYRIEE